MLSMSRLGIVASHDLEATPEIATQVAAALLARQRPFCLHVRHNSEGFTSYVEHLAADLHFAMTSFQATLHTARGPNRSDVYYRDFDLVSNVDRVIAFFRPDRLMEGGTGHVVYAALCKEVPVEIWTYDDFDNLVNIASDDGFDVAAGERESLLNRFNEWENRGDEIVP